MKFKALIMFLLSSINLISKNTGIIKADSLNIDNSFLLKDISKDVIFTTLVTISIFFLGLLFKYIYELNKERNRLNSIKKFFFKLIKSLIQPIEDQCNSYNTLSNNIKDFKQYDFPFEENPRLNTEGFRQVSYYDFYKSVVGTSKSKNKETISESFISTVNIIKSIELQKDFADINYREFISRHRDYINSFNNSVNKLLRSYDAELTSMKDGDSLLIDMSKVLSKSKNTDRNAKNIIDEIINPLYNLLLTKTDDSRTFTFLEIIISIRKSYTDLSNLKQIYSKLFGNFSNKLDSMSKELINNLRIFENKNHK